MGFEEKDKKDGFWENTQTNIDNHEGFGPHVDVRTRIAKGICEKIRFDENGDILTQEFEQGKKAGL